MSLRCRTPGAVLAAAVSAVLLAGACSGGSGTARALAGAPPVPIPLAAAAAGPGPATAVLPMGGSARSPASFWQLFVRAKGSASWRLATPGGVADNGGLVVSAGRGQDLVAGFVPSGLLTFTALATTRNGGLTWSPGLLRGRLAAGPDALAVSPAGALIAVTGSGAMASGPGRSWARLASVASITAGRAARSCALRRLTGAAFTPSGQPLLAGQCATARQAGIFARSGSRWQLAGPSLPAALAQGPVTVLRLASTGSGDVALLGARTAAGVDLIPAWSNPRGSWTTGPAYAIRSALTSASAASDGWAVVSGGRGAVLAGPGRSWQPLAALPAGTATLLAGPGQPVAAMAVRGDLLTIWQASGAGWRRAQSLRVPLP